MKTKGIVFLSLAAALALVALPTETAPTTWPVRMPAGAVTVEAAAPPLYFIANAGQADARALYYADAPGYTLWLTREGLVFDRVEKDGKDVPARSAVSLRFEGANRDIEVVAADPSDYRVSYFYGREESEWKTDIPTSRAVLYKNVYDGVDLKVYGTGREVEYDWVVAPGADPGRIRFSYSEDGRAALDEQGNLAVETAGGRILHRKPSAYQVIDGRKIGVEAVFAENTDGSYGFVLGAYDPSRELVIDPLVLAYSTYLGGYDSDFPYDIAVDPTGAVYVTGTTRSRDFPPVTQKWPREDVFVTKISPDGKSLVYSAFFPGAHEGIWPGLDVDPKGFVYLAASTDSSRFPVKNAFQSVFKGGSSDVVIVKLAKSGKSLVYSSYLGGSGADRCVDVAVDPAGVAVLGGATRSPDFPVKKAFQKTHGGNWDFFIAKVSAEGSGLVYSTFLGGRKEEQCHAMTVAADGAVVIGGSTDAPGFPLVNPFQKGYGGGYQDGIVAKLSPKGEKLVWSSYLGGNSYDYVRGLAADASGAVYIAGETQGSLPVKNPFQKRPGGNHDGLVAKIAADGKSLVYLSYLGGSGFDRARSIAVDGAGQAYVLGHTESTNFPLKSPFQAALSGRVDCYLTVVGASGDSLVASTYMGGKYIERTYGGIALSAAGEIYLCGNTNSPDFPVKGAYQSALDGWEDDAFVLKFRLGSTAREE